MNTETNFHVCCFKFKYKAFTNYRVVLILDILMGVSYLLNGILTVASGNYAGAFSIITGVYFCILAYLAFILFTKFEDLLKGGLLAEKTDFYLKWRMIGIIVSFVNVLLFIVIGFLILAVLVDDKVKVDGFMGAVIISLVIFLVVALLGLWWQYSLQQTLKEAKDAIVGQSSGNNQTPFANQQVV